MLEQKDFEQIAQIVAKSSEPILHRLDKVEREVSGIRLTLENETNRNIKIIAEGHLNLDRKLTDALKTESEKDMILIRLNNLENQVRRMAAAQAS